jgi:hypothetical protein
MILYLEDTRRVGAIGLTACLSACLLLVFFRFPSQLASYFWGALCLGCAAFYLYLIRLRRRCVVTLLNDELVWNTSSLSAPPVSARVSEIRAYRVESLYDSPLYRGSIVLHSSAHRDLGNLPLDAHRRIFSALSILNTSLEWRCDEQ